jgi:mRNA interferase MazF
MKRGEIWIVELPFANGKEQRGRRPCLVLAETKTDIVIVVPFTSNLYALRFPYTVEIKKSKENGLEKDSVALVFHVQALDRKRFVSKVGDLERQNMKQIGELLKKLLQL